MKANMCANKQMHIWTHPHIVYTRFLIYTVYPQCGQFVKEGWICAWLYGFMISFTLFFPLSLLTNTHADIIEAQLKLPALKEH